MKKCLVFLRGRLWGWVISFPERFRQEKNITSPQWINKLLFMPKGSETWGNFSEPPKAVAWTCMAPHGKRLDRPLALINLQHSGQSAGRKICFEQNQWAPIILNADFQTSKFPCHFVNQNKYSSSCEAKCTTVSNVLHVCTKRNIFWGTKPPKLPPERQCKKTLKKTTPPTNAISV